MKPRLFISAVTREFTSTSRLVVHILSRLSYEPVWEDIFGAEPGDLRPILRAKMEDCQGLIQLVGHGYGAEPPEPDAEFGRVSYTQFEFLHMRKLGRKTWLLFPGPGCTRDTAPEQLDLPRDPAHADPAGYQAERRALQEAYRQRLRASEHLYHEPQNDDALELVIERLRDEFRELRGEFARWQQNVTAHLERIEEGQRLTRERIRAHLLEASEKKLAEDLSAAEAVKGWEAREWAREAAQQAHAARLARIDDLARTFAEIEGRADASAVFRELTRILGEEGVDAALAYAERQRPSELESLRKLQAADRERYRARLRPFLQAAQLHAARGDVATARARFQEIYELQPDWPALLTAFGWFLYDQSSFQEQHGSLAQALNDASQMLDLAEKLPPTGRLPYADARVLPASLEQMGDVLVLRGQPGDAEKALGHYQRSLEVRERLLGANPESAQAARDVSVSHWKFFHFHRQGRPMEAPMRGLHERLKPVFSNDPP